jgi:hypothetical protein
MANASLIDKPAAPMITRVDTDGTVEDIVDPLNTGLALIKRDPASVATWRAKDF